MVALACADDPRFIPSLAESGADHAGHETFYSVDTVLSFKQKLKKARTRIYFIMGADSFLTIPTWKDYETLLGLCDFIVVNRPGFNLAMLRQVIPPALLPVAGAAKESGKSRSIALRRTTIYILDTISNDVSATAIRERLRHKRSIHGLVPPRVEDYIKKQALYR
jgi:nicotinate-nucleotide adenylyltransferase